MSRCQQTVHWLGKNWACGNEAAYGLHVNDGRSCRRCWHTLPPPLSLRGRWELLWVWFKDRFVKEGL